MNKGAGVRKITYIIEGNYSGTVGSYLAREKGVSRRLITKLKRLPDGITKNGVHARTVDTVSTGDIIELLLADTKVLEKSETLAVPVAYEDSDVIVFDKPPYMPVHPSHRHQGDTLGNFFAAHCEGLTFRPINRLDRNTSGLCVIAKNSLSAAKLQESLDKTYFAVACGRITKSGTIDAPIARTDESIITRCVSESGQNAVTHFEVLRTTSKYTYLKIKLETGRTHQIRVHFSHIGYPLVGDDLYGGDTSDIKRQALHCGEISFVHPITNEVISLSSLLPKDMESLLT